MTNHVCTGNKKVAYIDLLYNVYKYIQQSKLNSEDKITSFYKMLAKGLIRGIMLKKSKKSMNNYKELWNSVKSNIS